MSGRMDGVTLSMTRAVLDAHAAAPSGTILATCSEASTPDIAGLFSRIIGWPSPSLIFGATVRSTTSAAPPAGMVTVTWTGFAGKDCGRSGVASPAAFYVIMK